MPCEAPVIVHKRKTPSNPCDGKAQPVPQCIVDRELHRRRCMTVGVRKPPDGEQMTKIFE